MSYIKSTVRRVTGTAKLQSRVLTNVGKFSGYAMGTPTEPSTQHSNRVKLVGDPREACFKFVSLTELNRAKEQQELARLQDEWRSGVNRAVSRLGQAAALGVEYQRFTQFLYKRPSDFFQLCRVSPMGSYKGCQANTASDNIYQFFDYSWYGVFNDYYKGDYYTDIDSRSRVDIYERVHILKTLQRIMEVHNHDTNKHLTQSSLLQIALNIFANFEVTEKLCNDLVLWSFYAVNLDPSADNSGLIIEALKDVYQCHSTGVNLATRYVVSALCDTAQQTKLDHVSVFDRPKMISLGSGDKVADTLVEKYDCIYRPEISNLFIF